MITKEQKLAAQPQQSSLVPNSLANDQAGAGAALLATQDDGANAPSGDGQPSSVPALSNSSDAGQPSDAPETEGEPVKARVLRACLHGKPNDVVTLSVTVAEQAVSAGDVDTRASAVAYAEKLQAAARQA